MEHVQLNCLNVTAIDDADLFNADFDFRWFELSVIDVLAKVIAMDGLNREEGEIKPGNGPEQQLQPYQQGQNLMQA